jgi:riboflavin synthase
VFSGLVADRGEVVDLTPQPGGGAVMRVRCDGSAEERPQTGDSIAIDGVCLTATAVAGETIAFDLVLETLGRTTLAERKPGDAVNVEYALRLGDRLGGHFVYGHVDAAAAVLSRVAEGGGERLRIERPAALRYAIVDKAFVAVDGVSLTVAGVGESWFEIALIPETLARTTLGRRAVGSRVNVEADPLARYVAGALRASAP